METAGLPMDIQEKLSDLQLELAEGDITQQGYEKKRNKLLLPYLPSRPDSTGSSNSSLGRSASPYNPPAYQHVQQGERSAAVIAALESRTEQVPMSSRRYTGGIGMQQLSVSPSPSFDTGSQDSGGNNSTTATPLHSTPPPTLPKTSAVTQRQQLHSKQQPQPSEGAHGGGPGVSHKIQQLLNTLKRPKKNRKPIEQYYTEDPDTDVSPSAADPAAPRPVGPTMQPISGVPLESRLDWHRNLEAAIQHHSTTLGKHPAISTVDSHGKVTVGCTYNKLAAKAQKVANFLLNKLGNGKLVQPGDRVALVFKTDEAASFAVAFWGCIFAAVIPVAIQPPLTKDDPGGQQVGFLLNSLNVTVAITSELTSKQLPKEEGKDHISHCKGWPRLSWFVAEHLPKVPRDWSPPPRPSPDSTAYIEFTTDKEGSALGVTVSRATLLTHCRVLTTACQYKEGEIVICTEDPKRSIGLWHGIMAAAYCGLHVVFVPPYVMMTLPTVWLHMVNKHKASCVLSSSKCISSCISLSHHKELRDIKLDSVRMILLNDGANPWSLASSDSFFEAYAPKGLTREVICPCAGSPESLTISLRRPSPTTPSGRGVMSIAGLSYGVIRVEDAGSITSLTLQDVGLVMPGARIAVIKPAGVPVLCKTDEVGEVILESTSCGSGYWGLQGKTNHTFKVQLVDESDRIVSNASYVRTGLLGFVGEGGLVFICGTIDGLMQIAGRRHNMEDLIATVMAVEPHGFIYKERAIVFSVNVLKEERVVVIAEQKPHCTDEDAFTWMNSVVPAIESIHGINLYGIVLVGPGRLPKYPNGVVHVQDTKNRFVDGTLHPINLLMCPYQCVTNLPVPKQPTAGVTGAAQIMGDLVTGRAVDSSQSFTSSALEEESTDGSPKSEYLVDMLRWRATSRPDDQLFYLVDARGHTVKTLNAVQLLKRAERIGMTLLDKLKLNSGDIVALVFSPGLDLILAFYGCLLVGIAPVVIKPPASTNISGTLPAMKLTVDLSTARAMITSHNIIRFLKSKEATQVIDTRSLPPVMDIEDVSRKKLDKQYRPPTSELISYLDFNISTTGVLSGVKVSHAALYSMCQTIKSLMELYPSREIALCLDPYSGFGLILWCMSGIFAGNSTYLINPYDLEQNPLLWLSVLSNNKIRETYCSYSVIDLCCRELGVSIETLKSRNIDLSSMRSCVIVSEERPRVHLLNSFTTLFNHVGLDFKSVSTEFGCRVNSMICLQGPRQPETDSVYVDARALRMDRVTMLEKGSPNSLCLFESGKIIPNGRVTIVDPDTKMPCPHTDLGEIWISSSHNGSGYYGLKEHINDTLTEEHFKANLSGGGDVSIEYARTGYLGFMSKSDKTDANGAHYQSLYIVGSLEESLSIRGFRYHPGDLEASIIRSHRNICGSAVFISNKLLVVVAELHGDESEALDIVPVITTTLIEEHQVVTGIIVVVDPGVIPINSRGEKQRISLRDSFLSDEMDPIYVAYNL